MTAERNKLLESIATITADYREGDLEAPTPDHVDCWVRQFDEGVQIPILREFDYVLEKTYVSKKRMVSFLEKLAKRQFRIGESPENFWRKANFLRIQQEGNSQTELLSLFSTVLENKYGYGTKDCGGNGDTFIYLDDIMFSGNRTGSDLEKWIRGDAPAQVVVYVIVWADHAYGKWSISHRLEKAIQEAEKAVRVEYEPWFTIENRKKYSKEAKVLWPANLPDNDELNAYLELDHKYPFEPRASGGNPSPFSSEEGRQLLEREFTLAGIRIRNFSADPSDSLRPLGFSPFGLGFGSTIVTFRNCPNNCPLALWWGDTDAHPNHPFSKWYPLFPRKTYE